MNLAAVRKVALSLPEVTEEPHHDFGSFRVRGKIFVTVPPEQAHIHVFVSETTREQTLAMFPGCVDPLLWGGKVVGIRITLAAAPRAVVASLVRQAWEHKAPRTLVRSLAPPGAAA